MTPNLAILERADANLRRADQLGAFRQGLPVAESVSPRGQSAGVRQKGKWRVAGIWVFNIYSGGPSCSIT